MGTNRYHSRVGRAQNRARPKSAVSDNYDDLCFPAKSINEHLLALVTEEVSLDDSAINSAIDDLLRYIKHEKRETRVAVLNWIRHLHTTQAGKIFAHMHKIFPVLLTALTDTSDQVRGVQKEREHSLGPVIGSPSPVGCLPVPEGSATIRRFEHLPTVGRNPRTGKKKLEKDPKIEPFQLSPVSPFLIKFSISLLEMFRADSTLLQDRGILITR